MDNRDKIANENIVFFDGVCNLCNASVDFLMRKDRHKRLKYASLQSELAKDILPGYNVDPADLDSFAFLTEGKVHQRSSAALKVTTKLGGGYPLLGAFWIVPKFIRDAVYNFIARNRYKWFGKKDSCRVPTPEERALFLE